MIDFVKRRDLNRNYINTYKQRMEAVWRFANSDNSEEEFSIVDGDSEKENESNNN